MKKYYLLFFIAFLFPVVSLSCKQTVDPRKNSQWRGENRDGIYNETGLLKVWHTDGPQLLWKYEGLGDGYTSVSIADGKIYTTGMPDDNLVLFVFDLTGKLLAKKDLGKERGKDQQYAGPRSTVCVNDGKLYLYNSFGKLLCLDKNTLNGIWTKELFTDFDGKYLDFGINESPLIVDEKIIMTPGGVINNMVALNKNTGTLIWSAPGEGTQSAYCSPQYIGDQSVPIVVTNTADYIIALNADTGEKLWSFPRKNQFNLHPNTPIYYKDMIFSSTGFGEGAVMLRLKDGGKTVEQVWKNSEVDTQIGGAVKIGNYVYASGQQNRFWFCVDWNTGETMYRERSIVACNVISADGMLYCYSDKGTMNLVKPNPDRFELVSSFNVTLGTNQHWAHPVIHNGVLYVRHGDALMAYKVK
jgi:outer membrane protein assembly factor BamB